MPHISVMSRDLVLNISALPWHDTGARVAFISHACSIFIFTHAAQFTLPLIFACPATWVSGADLPSQRDRASPLRGITPAAHPRQSRDLGRQCPSTAAEQSKRSHR